MDLSLLSFTPKRTEKKEDRSLKTTSSDLVFQSPRRRRKQNALPLRDLGSSPSNLQNIEKNKTKNLTCRNSTGFRNDPLYSQSSRSVNKKTVNVCLGETVVLESSDTDTSTCSFKKSNVKMEETIVIESSDSEEFVSDSQPSVSPKLATWSGKSSRRLPKFMEDDKEKVKEVENFLDTLQDFFYKRRLSGSNVTSFSYRSPEIDADESKKTSERGKPVTSKPDINSEQGLEEKKQKNTKQVKENTAVDASISSSSKNFKKLPKHRNEQVERPKKALDKSMTHETPVCRGKEAGNMDNEKFENIVQWLDRVRTPALNEQSGGAVGKISGNEDSFVHSVRRPGYRHNVIVSDSESEDGSGKCSEASSRKRRSESKSDSIDESTGGSNRKKQSLSSDSDSGSSESLIITTKRRNKICDSESSADERERDAKLILSSECSTWRKKDSEFGSEGSGSCSTNKRSEDIDNISELSVVSATSMNRLLSNIYGDSWDKKTVLTPVVRKNESVKKQKKNISQTVPRVLKDNYVKDPPTKKNQKSLTPTFHLNRKHLDFNEQENIPTSPRQLAKPFKVPKPPPTPKTPKIPRTPSGTTSPRPTITLGFLRSLSVSPPSAQCNVKALYYKKDFKNKKEALTSELFAYYNKIVFDNKLPADMKIDWNIRLNRTAGFCYNSSVLRTGERLRICRIELATKVCTSPDRVRDTLIHELCHAAVWILDGVKGGHGPQWKAWARKATRKLPELPPIGRCHQYKIETKYTYKCKTCGYSIGRHSKSLDLARKRCGWCYGEFELLVNAKSRKAVTPRTPRVATGFALYVKENYKTVREEKKDLKHAEIMKLLGMKFSALKVQMNN